MDVTRDVKEAVVEIVVHKLVGGAFDKQAVALQQNGSR